jgi:hypothetical protein
MKKSIFIVLAIVLSLVLFAEVIVIDSEKATSDDSSLVREEAERVADEMIRVVEEIKAESGIGYGINTYIYSELISLIKEKGMKTSIDADRVAYQIEDKTINIIYIEGKSNFKYLICEDLLNPDNGLIDYNLDGLVSSNVISPDYIYTGDFKFCYSKDNELLLPVWGCYREQLVKAISYFTNKIS